MSQASTPSAHLRVASKDTATKSKAPHAHLKPVDINSRIDNNQTAPCGQRWSQILGGGASLAAMIRQCKMPRTKRNRHKGKKVEPSMIVHLVNFNKQQKAQTASFSLLVVEDRAFFIFVHMMGSQHACFPCRMICFNFSATSFLGL